MRRRRSTVLGAVVVAVGLLLTACGGGSTQGGDGAQGKIGVILPDTKSSSRWTTADPRYLKQAFEKAGVSYIIQNARGDAQRMQTIANQMITKGVTVLAIVNLDSASGAAIQREAEKKGVVTIDYDRLTLDGLADYYVSFDNVQVGRLQGKGLKKCLGEKEANIAYLNGAPTDNNATLFAKGAHQVLDRVDTYTKVAEQAVPDWDNQKAATIFEQMWTQNRGNIDGVLAANDGLANAAISILKKNNAANDVPVTGQDATIQGLQNILAGYQCMTVYKPIKSEARALSRLAIALAQGKKPKTEDTVTDPKGDRKVNAVLIEPVSVTKDNVKRVVQDGFVSRKELCTGKFVELCTQAGIK